jgi:hypothetical protein
MLTEIRDVRQHPGEPRRRWFRSNSEDLIVWYASDDSLVGFQLCYNRHRGERALTWMKDKGYSHLKVDDGETEPLTMKRAPILEPDGMFEPVTALDRFNSAATSLPEEIRQFVVGKIRDYPVDKGSND